MTAALYDVCHNKEDADILLFTLSHAGRTVQIRNDTPGKWSVWVQEVEP